MKPERGLKVLDRSWDLNVFLLLLCFFVLFESETSQIIVSAFLNPWRQQSLPHIARYSCSSCIFTFFVCVWDWCSILPACITAEYGSCTVLPAHISKNSQRTEGHARLSFYGSVTNYRLVCEIRVASLSPISLGKALCGVQHWSPAAEKLTGAAILKCIPGTSMLLSASGQHVVYKLEGPLSSYWKREDFIFNQALNCNKTKIYVQLLATWPLFMLLCWIRQGCWEMVREESKLRGVTHVHKP